MTIKEKCREVALLTWANENLQLEDVVKAKQLLDEVVTEMEEKETCVTERS